MGRIMNDNEHGVIGKGANAEGCEQDRPPIGRPEKTEASGDRRLHCDDTKRNRRSPPIMADETGNFRMRRQNGAAARRMRTWQRSWNKASHALSSIDKTTVRRM